MKFCVVADSGEACHFAKPPYLQNDKQQDGDSTNVCLKFLLMMKKTG
jgi:hypothetical protein